MKQQIVYLAFFSLILSSCNSNVQECKDSKFLLGNYYLDTSLLKSYNNDDTTILPLVEKNNLDKIVLVAEENKYHFEGCEESFRKYEGTWEYKPIGYDGDCYIYIHQREGSRKIPTDPFNIAVMIDKRMIVLPFKKDRY